MIYYTSDEYVEILRKIFFKKNGTTNSSKVPLSHLICLHWALVHVKVPHLGGEVVSSQQIASAVAELNVRHRGNDL